MGPCGQGAGMQDPGTQRGPTCPHQTQTHRAAGKERPSPRSQGPSRHKSHAPRRLALGAQTKGKEEKSRTQRHTVRTYCTKQNPREWMGGCTAGWGWKSGPASPAPSSPHVLSMTGTPCPAPGRTMRLRALHTLDHRAHRGVRPAHMGLAPKPSSPSHCVPSLLTGRRDGEEASRTYCPRPDHKYRATVAERSRGVIHR